MIDLYTWSTPNGRKVSIMLEECELPYAAHPVDINKDEQFKPDFLKIAPNNRIPAIVDRDTGLALFESGAILMYLADKTGKFWSKEPTARWHTVQWVMWQMGGLGPMLGQVHHFVKFNPGKAPYAEERYLKEAQRLYGVMDRQLAQTPFMAGDYSIADMAIWPWYGAVVLGVVYGAGEFLSVHEYKNVIRWTKQVGERPAVKRGRMVNSTTGKPENQLRERHDATDFDTKTQDKLEAQSGS
jgi:GST-like protein